MRVTFHIFNLGDSDDPEIGAGLEIGSWLETDKGQWVKQHAQDLKFAIEPDPVNWGHRCAIYGRLEGARATEYFLRWNTKES